MRFRGDDGWLGLFGNCIIIYEATKSFIKFTYEARVYISTVIINMSVVFHSHGLYHTVSHVKLLDSCSEDILDVVQTDLFQYMGFRCLGDDL